MLKIIFGLVYYCQIKQILLVIKPHFCGQDITVNTWFYDKKTTGLCTFNDGVTRFTVCYFEHAYTF